MCDYQNKIEPTPAALVENGRFNLGRLGLEVAPSLIAELSAGDDLCDQFRKLGAGVHLGRHGFNQWTIRNQLGTTQRVAK